MANVEVEVVGLIPGSLDPATTSHCRISLSTHPKRGGGSDKGWRNPLSGCTLSNTTNTPRPMEGVVLEGKKHRGRVAVDKKKRH